MIELVTRDRPDVVCLQELPVWALGHLPSWSGMHAYTAVARRSLLPVGARVVTALHLKRGGAPGTGLAEVSRVRFAPMDEAEIRWYVATGEPHDKAGAYGVQGLGARFIEEINGSFTNVMGLPARAVYRLLRDAPDPALASLALSSG